MKALVEDTFVKTNGQKVMFLTHSMGSPMTLYFLNQQTPARKDKYIQSWISLGGCWAGTIKALKVYAQGDYTISCITSFSDIDIMSYCMQAITWECEC